MLMGEYEHSVDAKGRLFVPAKLRSELGKTFVITKGVDGCIDVYPMDAWDRLQQSFAQQTLPKKKARDVSRFLFGNSMKLIAVKWKAMLPPSWKILKFSD